MPTGHARLAAIDLPDFGMPEASPDLPASIYPRRLEALVVARGGAAAAFPPHRA